MTAMNMNAMIKAKTANTEEMIATTFTVTPTRQNNCEGLINIVTFK